MIFKVPPHLLSLLILFLSLCRTSLALRRDPEAAEVLRCLDECNDEDVQEYIACHKECELRYREREERREEEERPGSRELDPRWRSRRGRGGEGGGGEWEPEGPGREREPARGPRAEYDQCRRLCEPFKRREREQCWEQCEERERARERRRDREREREVDSGVWDPPADPSRYERCEHACERQAGGQQRQLCKFRCRQEREREERERPGGGDVNLSLATTTEDPQQQFRHCRRRCEQQHHREPQREQCRQECERQFREQRRGKRNPLEQEEEEEEMGEWRDNPYYFHSRMLRSRFRSEEGQIRVLERFDRRSDLLRGLKNYRLEIFEANPNTFVLPHHIDADCILVVLKGEGTITLVGQEKRESHHLERGDVIRVPAGTTVYFATGSGCDEQVLIAKLIQPANTPGKFEEFYPVGTENPESYYTVFSSEILESSLGTSIDQIGRLFGQQRQGVIIRASEEQLQALSEHRGKSKKKKGHGSNGPFNLLGQKPIYSNEFGRFFQASPEEFKQLQDSGVSVTFAEVNQGSIMVPHYNSKSMTVVLVVEGYGWFEMACPHLGRARRRWWSVGGREQEEEEEQGGGARYEKVTSLLSPGDVFVIPAGHPIAIAAEQDGNLSMVGFGINARENQRIFLAGKENMINQMDREAKELSFDIPAREVDRVFGNQEESYFVSSQPQPRTKRREHREPEGSRQHQQSERMDRGDIVGSEGSPTSSPVAPILDLAGLF
ncbi:vicilin Jug r 2.0101 [Rhodamnia argentea]|uniref:Vicilin Jug r 2.0101 n=1 Tax=Rhodamnia argentea TaxID=178133 RepID=A0ABM3H0V1_9MYRT|nr:vicilin Jug r 2.0101 [Rhodamnia argentea]